MATPEEQLVFCQDKLRQYFVFWVDGDQDLMPFNDPDGGELRVVAALRDVMVYLGALLSANPQAAATQALISLIHERFAAPGANDNLPARCDPALGYHTTPHIGCPLR